MENLVDLFLIQANTNVTSRDSRWAKLKKNKKKAVNIKANRVFLIVISIFCICGSPEFIKHYQLYSEKSDILCALVFFFFFFE